ncbi:MAG: hypothetical protein QF464_03590, partial [Myxococcota bacterium]|nr:hypothetical protein [Myxococcota bacterium]
AVGAEVLATLKGGDVSAAHRALNALHDALGTSALDGINFLRSHPVGSVRREALDALIQTRGWQELKTRGTPLAEALRSACESTTEVTEEERVA